MRMKFRAVQVLTAAMVGLLSIQIIAPGLALAHERRAVGKYTFVVGFLEEPAIEGQPNGVSLRVTDTATNEPVEGAEKTIKATVAAGGGQPKEFALKAVFGQKGAYKADLIPTRSGSYIFTFAGSIDGQQVNEKFESGPNRFNEVESPQSLQFPEPVPPVSELARQVSSMQGLVTGAERRAEAAEQRAAGAQTWAFAGLGVGALGLAAGLYGLTAGRRKDIPTIKETVQAK